MVFDVWSDCKNYFSLNREFRLPCDLPPQFDFVSKEKKKHFQIRPEVINFAYVLENWVPHQDVAGDFSFKDGSKRGGWLVEKFFPEKRALWMWRFMLR